MRKILIGLLILVSQFLSAQQTLSTQQIPGTQKLTDARTSGTYPSSSGHFMTKYIRIVWDKKEKPLPGSIPFSGTRFIDDRLDTGSIANFFLGGERLRLNLENGFSTVNQYVKDGYGSNFSDDRDSLLVMVNDFSTSGCYGKAGQRLITKRYQLIRLKAELAEKHGRDLTPIGSIDTLLVFEYHRSKGYRSGIKQAIRKILLQAGDLSKNQVTSAGQPVVGKLTEESFVEKYGWNGRGYAILRDKDLKRGVYLDFRQFVDNSPQPGILVSVEEHPKKMPDSAGLQEQEEMPEYQEVTLSKPVTDSGRSVKLDSSNIWGYCDGNIIYVNSKSRAGFYPLTRDGFLYNIPATNEKAAKARTARRGSTVMTIVGVAAVVALVVVVVCLSRNAPSGGSSSRGGGGSSGRGGSGRGGGGGSSAAHHNPPNIDFGSFSGGPVSYGNIFILPEIIVTDGGSSYKTRATRIDMQTGLLVF
ncbi:MAG: hypothetical protein P4L51_08365 [Puia sp.]|nr:hypothetical protein [Puia sp.]